MSERAGRLKDAEATMRMLQHEVRTPLGHIIGYAEMLEEEVLERNQEDLTEDLERIRKAARRLLDLVDGKLLTDPTEEIAQAVPDSPDRVHNDDIHEAAVSDATRGRILVVDADVESRERLGRRLEEEGFEVETAKDGIDGLRRIASGACDLVVLDVLLPGMNGFEVLERIRRSRSMSELPVVLVAELAEVADAVEGLDRGGNDYIVKPFDPALVVARIEAQLTAHRSARQVAALARQLEFRNAFMRQALGRHVSEDLLVELSERPDATALGGERRNAVALVADIRGTHEWVAGCTPDEVFRVLNNVFGPLCDVVTRYGGTVDAIFGDSLIALFGLPLPEGGECVKAAACGIALQLAMKEVNARNRRAELPEVEIGVGIAVGEVLVGGIGRGEGLRYSALGAPAILAAVIERAARPGEVLVSDAVVGAADDLFEIGEERMVQLGDTGDREPLHSIVGVGGGELISLRKRPGE